MSKVPMASADLDETDVAAVMEVVRSGRLALGPKTVEFEERVAERIGVPHAVAVNSGTAALHLAVRGLEYGPGDEILVPSFTFAASVNAMLYERARPIFVDIEPDTFNLAPEDVERKINSRTRAIMVVDVFGHPAEWDALLDVARHHRLEIIDDSCEALGAEYRGRKIGSLGEVATFAFYPNKQITTGEGGMLVTADAELARLARSLRNQGRGEMGAWVEHERLGYNYRMDEMSAALGVSQLAKLDTILERRSRVAEAYGRRLSRVEAVRPPVQRDHVRHSWFVYVVTLEEGLSRDPVMEEMERRGIPVRGYFQPLHLQDYLAGPLGLEPGSLPVTESVARRTVALPFHNRLGEDEVDTVVGALEESIAAVRSNAPHPRCR